MNGTMTPSPIICPDITSYFPCSCTPDLSIDNDPHITLICDKLNLTDSKMSDILDAFLTTPNVSKILRLALPGNNLTRLIKSYSLVSYTSTLKTTTSKLFIRGSVRISPPSAFRFLR